MSPALGVIADDFTGAVFVGTLLESAGVPCPVIFDADALRDETAPVLVCASRTRTIAVADALSEVARIGKALKRAGVAQLAYKACSSFDSTADGNIGPAADLLADLAGRRPVLMSAGFPRFDTTVHQGYLFYRGRLVTDSIKRLDPLTPMEDPDLVRFLGRQTPRPVRLIAHGTLLAGHDAVLAELARLGADGAGHVLFDTSDDGDVAVTADVAAATGLPVAASDPLIVALACKLAKERSGDAVSSPPPPRPRTGTIVTLAGSTGPVVMQQIAAYRQVHPVLSLDLLDPSGVNAQVAAALDWAAAQGGRHFAIATSCDAPELARVQASLGPIAAARKAESLLAAVATGLRARGVAQFNVAGGETSGAVVAALDIRRGRALPEGDLGVGPCVGEDANGNPVWLFLKAGKLGGDDILLRATEAPAP